MSEVKEDKRSQSSKLNAAKAQAAKVAKRKQKEETPPASESEEEEEEFDVEMFVEKIVTGMRQAVLDDAKEEIQKSYKTYLKPKIEKKISKARKTQEQPQVPAQQTKDNKLVSPLSAYY